MTAFTKNGDAMHYACPAANGNPSLKKYSPEIEFSPDRLKGTLCEDITFIGQLYHCPARTNEKIYLPFPVEHVEQASNQVIAWRTTWRALLLLKNQPFPPTLPH